MASEKSDVCVHSEVCIDVVVGAECSSEVLVVVGVKWWLTAGER